MTTFDFSMTPGHAAAFRDAALLSARHACSLAMCWLEAGSDSTAVASLALEDPSYVNWRDISATFHDALTESGVGELTPEEAHALRIHAAICGLLNREVSASDFLWFGNHVDGDEERSPTGTFPAISGRVFKLALELDEALMGQVSAGRDYRSVDVELRHEAALIKAQLETDWPFCRGL